MKTGQSVFAVFYAFLLADYCFLRTADTDVRTAKSNVWRAGNDTCAADGDVRKAKGKKMASDSIEYSHQKSFIIGSGKF